MDDGFTTAVKNTSYERRTFEGLGKEIRGKTKII